MTYIHRAFSRELSSCTPLPPVLANIVTEYAASEEFQTISEQRGILCSITVLFLSVITFGLWNYIQTKRFWNGLKQEANSKSSEIKVKALSKMESAVRWGADLSSVKTIDFIDLIQKGEKTFLLDFLAHQIHKNSGETDPIFQQFCYYITECNQEQEGIKNRLLYLLKNHITVAHSNGDAKFNVIHTIFVPWRQHVGFPALVPDINNYFKYAADSFRTKRPKTFAVLFQ